MIPSRQWTSELMAARNMPPHIVRHSRQVRLVSLFVARSLLDAGFAIDMQLVDRAALLHDICKADTIRRGGDHALMGRRLMEEFGYRRIGLVIGQHVRLDSMDVNEAMVVNYSDKRVMHDRVVSLERRFIDLMERYGTSEQSMERILRHFEQASEVERVLARASGIEPARLELLNLVAGNHTFDRGQGFL
ncbi:MAG TPA: HDIG domain-containing protein [Deltaproteobacteria bacterium]|mgnify:FL=1|nr:HDIG domain-containing protein [Deltaproteobacteria bacterium]HOD69851.1 HDIG domain-containing protein [Deltaproteobacteria bacterium]HOS28472.1 HDIG domain-containing protein [Deltaproteobacteria bacterium]HPV27995.1 HDIG domain-containing protein [Deltaproteobacteria bacterium]HPX49500.1 HDIG domain-containing protein [Deltaproteobacteria bacterium]